MERAHENEDVRLSITDPVGRVRIDSVTSLWRAAEHGDLERLKRLLKSGHDPNAFCDEPKSKRQTPLAFASAGNEPLAVRLLLRHGANPNLQDGDGDRYPLHWASAFGDHAECAEILLQASAALDARDAFGRTPLEYARGAADGSVHGFARFASALIGRSPRRDQVISVLERGGHEVRAARVVPWSPELAKERLSGKFWKAAAAGDVSGLEHCLDQLAQPIDQPRPAPVSRLSALAISALHGHVQAVEILLNRGASANAAEPEGGFTPLFFCCHLDDHHLVANLLLQHTGNPLVAKSDGVRAVEYAARMQRPITASLFAARVERDQAFEALADALNRIEDPTTILPPRADYLAVLVQKAQGAGVDSALVERGREAALALASSSQAGGLMRWFVDWFADPSNPTLAIAAPGRAPTQARVALEADGDGRVRCHITVRAGNANGL